ncbi:MAG: ATP-binding cassette domain-containing protein [Sandaracinus sp.]|nr:ATP-binding cassette domain-containing protein [Sandaracinus sp.]
MLHVRSLDVTLPERPLLRGVSFELAPGHALTLRGRSGLGKSTLLRLLAGLHGDPGESVTFEGASARATGFPTWRRRVTYLAQTPTMLEGSVRENLARPFSYASATATFDEIRAKAWLDALALPDVLDRDAKSLSGGEKQRVHLVRALLGGPRVLLADEPTASLDPETRTCVLDFVDARVAEGLAVLFVRHDAPADATLDLEAFRA